MGSAKLDSEFVLYDRSKPKRPSNGGVLLIRLDPNMKDFFGMKLREYRARTPDDSVISAANVVKIKLVEQLLEYGFVVPLTALHELDINADKLSDKDWEKYKDDFREFERSIHVIAHYAEGNVTSNKVVGR